MTEEKKNDGYGEIDTVPKAIVVGGAATLIGLAIWVTIMSFTPDSDGWCALSLVGFLMILGGGLASTIIKAKEIDRELSKSRY